MSKMIEKPEKTFTKTYLTILLSVSSKQHKQYFRITNTTLWKTTIWPKKQARFTIKAPLPSWSLAKNRRISKIQQALKQQLSVYSLLNIHSRVLIVKTTTHFTAMLIYCASCYRSSLIYRLKLNVFCLATAAKWKFNE